MDCGEVRQRLHEWIDGELDDETQWHFKNHLHECPECSRQAKSGERLKHLVRVKARREPLPPGLAERVRGSLATETVAGSWATSGATRRMWKSAAALALAAFVPLIALVLWPKKTSLVHAEVAEESLGRHLRFLNRQSPQLPTQGLSL